MNLFDPTASFPLGGICACVCCRQAVQPIVVVDVMSVHNRAADQCVGENDSQENFGSNTVLVGVIRKNYKCVINVCVSIPAITCVARPLVA